MTRIGKSRLIIYLLSLCILSGFILFWKDHYREIKSAQLKKHCSIISEALWKIDGKTIEQYFRLASEYDYYRTVAIYLNPDETPFIMLRSENTPICYGVYSPLGFMKILELEELVFYEDREIGRIAIETYNTSAIVYGIALMGTLFFILALSSVIRIVYHKKDLEDNVRRKTEEYRISEERYRTLVRNIPGISYRCYYNRERKIDYISEEAERMTGYSFSDFRESGPLTIDSLIVPEDRSHITVSLEKSLKEQTPFMLEYRIADKEGAIHWVYDRGQIVYNETVGAWTVEGVIIDISERHKIQKQKEELEEQYRQAQKLESIGRLAGGIAHDINNMLTPVLGYADIMISHKISTDEMKAFAQEIAESSLRARDLIGKILTYSRKDHYKLEMIGLNSIVNGFRAFLRSFVREEISLKYDLTKDATMIQGDIAQLEQVILNLVVNSQDAIKDSGHICIKTTVVYKEKTIHSERDQSERGYFVVLEVKDDGSGMDGRTKEQICEPFFSTKGTQGTGLGMSTVYGIIKQHNGFLSVISEPEKGCAISIYLPLAKPPEKKGKL